MGEACPHRRCCNPAHLEASTIGANASRAKKGVTRHERLCGAGLHERSPENTYEAPSGAQRCRPCDAKRARDRKEQARQERPAGSRTYRKRGMDKQQLVEWALGENEGTGCYAWPGKTARSDGYVEITFEGRTRGVHVLVHEVVHGPVPKGWVVDHTCHDPRTCEGGHSCSHRACVNPDHLKAVTKGENSGASRSSRPLAEKCKRGHEFTEENIYLASNGARHCRKCQQHRNAKRDKTVRKDQSDGRARVDGRCRNGHVVAEVGLTKRDRCAECQRESSRRIREANRKKSAV